MIRHLGTLVRFVGLLSRAHKSRAVTKDKRNKALQRIHYLQSYVCCIGRLPSIGHDHAKQVADIRH